MVVIIKYILIMIFIISASYGSYLYFSGRLIHNESTDYSSKNFKDDVEEDKKNKMSQNNNVIDKNDDNNGFINSKEDNESNKEDVVKKTEIASAGISEKQKEATNLDEKKLEKEIILNKKNTILDKLISWGYTHASRQKIDTIILHSSYNSLGGDEYDVDKIIGIYKKYNVSAHYIIGRDGIIYRLVEEKNIAWHAGSSLMPDGRTNVNDFSIGVEIVGNKNDGYTKEQYNAVNLLIKEIKKENKIKYILGHDEIAPGRKTDPWGLDWNNIEK